MDESIGFNNVGGLHEHIQCLKEMVLFPLIYKNFYENFKIKPPKGVLFYGPPGTGKTLIAGALANECGRANRKVSFFTRKGAECLTKWVGESEKHLRTLFEKAQQLNPSIIFFDEIDGLAPIRSSHHDQIHSSVVSTLLALMDGLHTKGQVVVIGATNRIDAIDPALRRPGRFDRELYFPLPAFKARHEILMVHAGRLSEQISLPFICHLAATTEGYCGSDLQALCSEAVMCSVRRQFPQIYTSDHPIDLNVSVLRVERRDFQKAKSTIVPAALRVSYSPSKRLSSKIRPLFGHTLCRAMAAMRKTSLSPFLHATNGQRRNASEFEASSSNKNFKVNCEEGSSHGNVCSHFLLVGSAQQGQTDYLAPAMLHCLEGLPVIPLDITSLFESSGRTPEEACIQKIKEARQSLPGILYMPDISGWWELVDEATRAVFLAMVRELDAGDFPILLLATAHSSYGSLSPEIQKLFSIFQGQVFTMENPSEKDRKEFFSRLFFKKACTPPALGDISNSSQRQVLLCKIPENVLASKNHIEPQTVKSKRGKKSKENNLSNDIQRSDVSKTGKSTQNKRKTEISPEASSHTKRVKMDGIHEEDDYKETCHAKGFKSASLSLSAYSQRHNSQKKKHQRKVTSSYENKHKIDINPFGLSNDICQLFPVRNISQDDDYLHECEKVDDILSYSSSSTSLDDGHISLKNENESREETLKMNKVDLESLLNYTVKITENCTIHTILTLHSKLMFCVSKYKDVWDRSKLIEDLKESIQEFEDYVISKKRLS